MDRFKISHDIGMAVSFQKQIDSIKYTSYSWERLKELTNIVKELLFPFDGFWPSYFDAFNLTAHDNKMKEFSERDKAELFKELKETLVFTLGEYRYHLEKKLKLTY